MVAAPCAYELALPHARFFTQMFATLRNLAGSSRIGVQIARNSFTLLNTFKAC